MINPYRRLRAFGGAASFLALALFTAVAPMSPASAMTAPVCGADDIQIETLPFDVLEDFSIPFAHLDGEGGEVGLVRQTTTVIVEGCRATVGYVHATLFVASELRGNACAFETVLAHEQRHVDIYRRALLDLPQRIRVAAANRPLFQAAVDEVNAVRKRQAAFDDRETAARGNVTACGGRIYKLAMHIGS